jgi:hypothetical protein
MRRPLTLLALCALLAGCGGGGATTNTKTAVATTPPNPTAELEQAVRTALQQNAKVSDYVLEHNAIPSWASQSTAGPVLAGMRGSAAQRKTGHVTVRVLSDRVEIHSIHLDPSYASATANVTERSRVVPYRHGRALGKPVAGNEHAHFVLHRVGNRTTFVVWKVAPA